MGRTIGVAKSSFWDPSPITHHWPRREEFKETNYWAGFPQRSSLDFMSLVFPSLLMDVHENFWAARTWFQEEETSWHIKSCIGSRSVQSEQELWVGGRWEAPPRKWWAHLNKETADSYLEKQTGRKAVAAHSGRIEGQSSSGTNMLFPNWVGWGGGQSCQDFPLTRWIPGKVTELESDSKTSPQRAAGKAKCQRTALSWGWGSWIRNIERNTRRVDICKQQE